MQYFVDCRIPLKSGQHRAALSPIDVKMTDIIGQPKHSSHVRAAGVGATINQYLALASASFHTSMSINPEELHRLTENITEQLTKKIRDELEQSINQKVTKQLMLSFN